MINCCKNSLERSTLPKLIQGNIVNAKVDAIVNAANPVMLGGGGVDGAIHQAAGAALLTACQQVPVINGIRCPFGEARITTAGKLAAQYVIHTAGPIYNNESEPAKVLASSYQNSLELALAHHCQSIAFPAISCGVYGYPAAEAANVALSVCMYKQYQGLAITFYLYGDDIFRIWQQQFAVVSHSY